MTVIDLGTNAHCRSSVCLCSRPFEALAFHRQNTGDIPKSGVFRQEKGRTQFEISNVHCWIVDQDSPGRILSRSVTHLHCTSVWDVVHEDIVQTMMGQW